jgi:hypothetical protein
VNFQGADGLGKLADGEIGERLTFVMQRVLAG